MRAKLLEARKERPFPHKDDKILTGWNGLMIEALAYAGRVLDEPSYTRTSEKAADFLLNNLWTGDGLLRSYREGRAHQPAFLDDHAYLAAGLLELHAATGDERWLKAARRLGDILLAEFNDPGAGGFFLTRESETTPFARSKALRGGGNLPAPNGTAARVLRELADRTGEERYAGAAEATLRAFAGLASGNPHGKEAVLLAMLSAERPESDSASVGASGKPSAENRPEMKSGQPENAKPGGESGQPEAKSPEPEAESGQSEPENVARQREGPVAYSLATPKSSYAPGESIPVRLRLGIDKGWHLYGKNPELDFLVPVRVEPVELHRFEVGEPKAPEPKEKVDPILDKTVRSYEGEIGYQLPYRVKTDAKPGPAVIAVTVTTQACDADRCLPPETVTLRLPVDVAR